jgi:hypothetical protein
MACPRTANPHFDKREQVMKTLAIALLLAAMAVPATAAIIHDEGVNGDLSSNEAAPTALAFPTGTSTIIGSVHGSPIDRDYITFTIGPNQVLAHLNLIALSPNNLAFTAFNAGSTSYIPSGSTNGLFLSGIHIDANDVGDDLMPYYDTRNVTTNSLSSPSLGPGTYCWMIQQTNPILQTYRLDWVIDQTIATEPSTWGKVKALYR